jgi:hypothetical protein
MKETVDEPIAAVTLQRLFLWVEVASIPFFLR